MASPRTSIHTSNPLALFLRKSAKGFTLIEILIVFGLIALLGGLVLFVSMDTFRGTTFRSERDVVVGLLQHARAQAMHNICNGASCTNGMPHGVHVQNDAYIMFQGATYNPTAATNARFDADTSFVHSGYLATNDIFFSQLSGTTSCGVCDLTIADTTGRSSTITVSGSGQILWTH